MQMVYRQYLIQYIQDMGHRDVVANQTRWTDLGVAKKNSHHSNHVYPISLQLDNEEGWLDQKRTRPDGWDEKRYPSVIFVT